MLTYFSHLGHDWFRTQIADDTNVLFSGCGTDGDGMSFLSSGNNMTIIFHADESLNEQGFEAFYEGKMEVKNQEVFVCLRCNMFSLAAAFHTQTNTRSH